MRNKTRESLGFCSRKSLKRFFRRNQNDADETGVLSGPLSDLYRPRTGDCAVVLRRSWRIPDRIVCQTLPFEVLGVESFTEPQRELRIAVPMSRCVRWPSIDTKSRKGTHY